MSGVIPIVSSKGGRFGFVYRARHAVYRALRRDGKSKTAAAKTANAGGSTLHVAL